MGLPKANKIKIKMKLRWLMKTRWRIPRQKIALRLFRTKLLKQVKLAGLTIKSSLVLRSEGREASF